MPKLVTVHKADGNHTEFKFNAGDFQGVMGEVWGSRVYVANLGLIDVIESQDEVERLVREAKRAKDN